MSTPRKWLWVVALCVLLCPVIAIAQELKPSQPAPQYKAPQTVDASAAELSALRETSREFVTAFNRGDAKAVAALWTEDGEYVDDAGRVFSGRESIEKEYAAFFAANKGVQMHLAIDSLRLLSPEAAIEDGRARLDPAPPGAPGTSKYTAVHVKANGHWRMSTVTTTSPTLNGSSAPGPRKNTA
jgi:uncharacterized protein (TIGR02246 family)